MGAAVMLGTLFGLIVLIFGLVLRYDPEARRRPDGARRRMSDELTPLLTASIAFAYVGGFTFVALGVYLSVPSPSPAPTAPRVHLGRLRSPGSRLPTTGRCTRSSRPPFLACRLGGR